MDLRDLIGESISWGFSRPVGILLSGGKDPDERIRDAIDSELKVWVYRLREKDCDGFDIQLMKDMFHPRKYASDFPFYSSSHHKLRAEFRPLHDEICFHLYTSPRGGGRKKKWVKERPYSGPLSVLNTL